MDINLHSFTPEVFQPFKLIPHGHRGFLVSFWSFRFLIFKRQTHLIFFKEMKERK